MIITDECWNAISDRFTEEEKLLLCAAVVGNSICPRGTLVDVEALESRIKVKLQLKVSVYLDDLMLQKRPHGNISRTRAEV